MPLSRKWKLGILIGFLSLSLGLLFIPYREELVFGYFDPYDGISRPVGNDYSVHIPLPWRSHSQTLKILLNVSKGKVNMTFLDHNNYLNWIFEDSYTHFLQYENITFFDDIITLQPPLEGSIFILITPVEDSTINPKFWFNHLVYYNNYGLFFSGITLVIAIVYLNQVVHKKFNFR